MMHLMPVVAWRLRVADLLKREGLSRYRVAKHMERHFGVASAHVYVVLNGKAAPSWALLQKLHAALEALLGREVGVDEIIEVVRE